MAKITVSFAIEPESKAAIDAEIANTNARGQETDFSKWMRDAIRLKLARHAPVARPRYQHDLPYGATNVVDMPPAPRKKVRYSEPSRKRKRAQK